MEIYVLEQDLSMLDVMDSATSVIWTPRYYDVGDFEIYMPATLKNVGLFIENRYVVRENSKMVGIIENVNIKTDAENGNYLTVSGRCLKSLLERRIIWGQTNLNGKTELALRRLITENAISPQNDARKIPGLTLGEIKGFEETIDMQITGDNLLNKVIEICKSSNIGWEVYLKGSDLVVDFYKGVDRSYSQSVIPYVVFSPEFDNLLLTETKIDVAASKNVALVAGEGEGTARTTTTIGEAAGLSRREMFVDARDISSNDGEIPSSEYIKLLQSRGIEKLAEQHETLSIAGEALDGYGFEFNKDYFLGDIVAVSNEYGIRANSRIIEVIECEDENGRVLLPTFEDWRII